MAAADDESGEKNSQDNQGVLDYLSQFKVADIKNKGQVIAGGDLQAPEIDESEDEELKQPNFFAQFVPRLEAQEASSGSLEEAKGGPLHSDAADEGPSSQLYEEVTPNHTGPKYSFEHF